MTTIGTWAFASCTALSEVTIPASVETIGEFAFYNCEALASVTLPEGVTSIGNSAFRNCSNLTSVTIPEGVTSIGGSAFSGCSSLTSITIPSSVTSIGDYAFSSCENLKITVDSANTVYVSLDGALFNKAMTELICGPSATANYTIPEGVTSIGDGAFSGCSGLTSVTIPEGVTFIGSSAFSGCYELIEITIPVSVETIGNFAFSECTTLTSVVIPSSVTTIGACAFVYCTALSEIIIPASVETIGEYAFAHGKGLTSVTFEGVPPEVGEGAFTNVGEACVGYYPAEKVAEWEAVIEDGQWNGLTMEMVEVGEGGDDEGEEEGSLTFGVFTYEVNEGEVTIIGCDASVEGELEIPATIDGYPVTTIGDWAFSECTALTSVTLPEGVITIGDSAFYNCEALTTVVISEGVESIGNSAFAYCYELTSVTIPSSVTSIGDWAFAYCYGLTSVTIPEGVKTIGDSAFYKCEALTTVVISEGVESIGNSAFYYCDGLTSVTIPEGVTTIGAYAFCECSKLTEITIPESVETIGDYAFAYCYELTELTIPEGVITIGVSAFYDCSGLTSVDLPSSVETIGDEAFAWCSGLTSVTIPASVETIGDWAFAHCTALTFVTLPEGLTTIGAYAFYDSYELTEITIPEGVETIGDEAFAYCGALTSVTIPSSVTEIGDWAFDGCESLIAVMFEGEPPTSVGESAFGDSEEVIGRYTEEYEAAWQKVLIDGKWNGLTMRGPYVTITFDANGGDGGATERIKFEIAQTAPALTAPTVTREGLTFLRWEPELPETVPLYDVTYTARWGLNGLEVGGDADWTQDRSGILQSGDIEDSESTWLQTEVSGGTRVTFSWMVSSEEAYDRLTFYVDDEEYASISGSQSWEEVTLDVVFDPEVEKHTLRWEYAKDGSVSIDEDCGWLKDVVCKPMWTFAEDEEGRLILAECLDKTYTGALRLPAYNGDSYVEGIAANAFKDCTGLTSVVIPYDFVTIGEHAFAGCTSLTEVIFEGRVPEVGASAFPAGVRVCYSAEYAWDWEEVIADGQWNGVAIGTKRVTLTFDANGGIVVERGTESTSLTLAWGEYLYDVLPEVERTAYDFDGWSPEVPDMVPMEDATYVAQWYFSGYETFYETDARGIEWEYHEYAEGVCIRYGGYPSDEVTENYTLTIPETLGGKPVIAIMEGAIDGTYQLTRVVLPKTVRLLLSYSWWNNDKPYVSDSCNPIIWELFDTWWDGDDDYRRTEPITVQVQGTLLENLDCPMWYEGYDYYDEEIDDWVWGYNEAATRLELPTDATYRAQWERAVTDENIIIVEEEGATWNEMQVVDFEPKTDDRFEEILDYIESCKTSTDATGVQICEALKLVVNLQANETLREFVTGIGPLSISESGTWSVSATAFKGIKYEEVTRQPREVLDMLLSDEVRGDLEAAITALESVEPTWKGSVEFKPADTMPLTSAVSIDATDALIMKSALESTLAALYMVASYNLQWDYTKPIESPKLEMVAISDTEEASWKNVPAAYYNGGQFTVQVASVGDDLVFRFTPCGSDKDDYFDGYWYFGDWGNNLHSTEAFGERGWETEKWHSGESLLIKYHGMVPYYDEAIAELEEYDEGEIRFHLHREDDDWECLWLEPDTFLDEKTIFEEQKNLLDGRTNPEYLAPSKTYFVAACNTMMQALEALRARADEEEHFWNLGEEVTEDDITLVETAIDQALAALDEVVEVTYENFNERVYLAPLFTAQGPDRRNMPTIVDGEFVVETLPDHTFGGIFPDRVGEGTGTFGPYAITFDSNGGEGDTTETLNYCAPLTAPVVTREGHEFLCWEPALPAIVLASDMTYTAQWKVNQYTATFKLENGAEDIVLTQDYATELVVSNPTREGYTFKGWDQEVPATMPAADITYTAQWQINQYTATFELYDGAADIVKTQDYATDLAAPAVTREGYTFKGWDEEVPATMPAVNTKYIAQWQINQYTATFKPENGAADIVKTQDYATDLVAPVVTREGYTFKGWDQEVPATMPAVNTTYTAQWKINQYTIAFNPNGGVGGGSLTQDFGTTVVVPSVEREGYTFVGWDKNVSEKVPAANVTYTAQWKVNQYTATFKLENGAEDIVLTQDYGTALKAPVVTREDYVFIGWDKPVVATMPANNLVYVAQWKLAKVDVKYITCNVNKKGEATITGCSQFDAGWLDIPAKLGDATVVAIANNAFKGQTKLEKVTLPDTITSIGKDAFKGCTNLDVNAVKMPNQPKLKVGKGAFTGCKVVEITAVPGETKTGTGVAGYKVATAVSGFKLNAKSGAWTATFKKPGTYEAVLFKPGANLKVVRIQVGAVPTVSVTMEGANKGCSVKGAGAYLMGKKVTLTAKTSKEKIFVGFYDAQNNLLSSAMKYTFVMGRENVTLTAKFKEEVIDSGISALTATQWQVGQSYTITLPVMADSGVKSVKAKLPSGLKLSKTKAGVWQVTGSPKKVGTYTVTITVGTMQKKQKVDSATITVKTETTRLDLTAVKNATLNVSQGVSNLVIGASATSQIKSVKASKLPSGMKVQCINGVWQLTGTPKKAGTYKVTVTMTTKAGTKVVETLTLTVNLVPEWAAKTFSGTVVNAWEGDDGDCEEVSGLANVTITTTGAVSGSIYCEDGASALLSGTAKLLESSTEKVRLQVTVPWFDENGKADGKVKTELIINNDKGKVTLEYQDAAKDSYVTGMLSVK